jgi:hypothetical protein
MALDPDRDPPRPRPTAPRHRRLRLRPGCSSARAGVSTPLVVDLAGDAEAVLAAVAAGPSRRLAARAFARQVEVVRRHLAPIADARLLATSFAREAFDVPVSRLRRGVEISPVRLAYAIRWTELQAGRDLAAWPTVRWPPDALPTLDRRATRRGGV